MNVVESNNTNGFEYSKVINRKRMYLKHPLRDRVCEIVDTIVTMFRLFAEAAARMGISRLFQQASVAPETRNKA